MNADRLFQSPYTESRVAETVRSLDATAVARLCGMPALFMYEEHHKRPGWIGRIINLKEHDGRLLISFEIDDRPRQITWDALDDLTERLGIDDRFELRTTHWAVKDIDLLQVLRGVGVQQTATRPRLTNAPDVEHICAALEQFDECARYINTRRSGQSSHAVDSEAAVQDLLYLMLRPWVTDLTPEEPVGKAASRYSITDFFSKAAQTVVEAKFIRDAAHGKSVTKELHDDIETYRNHPFCHTLIFFVYDSKQLIPDKAALVRQIDVPRTYGGVPFTCRVIVKP
jgi:hypothetical protein